MSDLFKVYKILKDKKYHTAKEISKILNLSDKTCRKLINQLNESIKIKNLKITSKARYGYILNDVLEKEEEFFKIVKSKIPITNEDRIFYLINKLLFSDEYIKLENVSREIYISIKTLSNDIKKIENILNEYNLKIDRKPYYGIKVKGLEINKRNLLIDYIEKSLNENSIYEIIDIKNLNKISNYSKKFFLENNIKISDISFQNLIVSVYVTMERIKNNFFITSLKLDNEYYNFKYKMVKNYIKYFEDIVSFSENDIKYILIHFLTNESITYKSLKQENIEEIKNIINKIIMYIKLTFDIDLTDDKILYENLYTHLLPLIIRIRFKISIKNPILDDIKEMMLFEYNIATYICNVILSDYGLNNISENEIAYIALILHMSTKLKNKFKNRKNILLVCRDGRGISKFLVFTFQKLFKKYLNTVNSCGLNELEKMNLKDIDVIFSVIEIDENIFLDKPIYKIDYFLNNTDINNIEKILNSENEQIEDIFSKDLFMIIDEDVSKEYIIEKMSEKLEIKIKSNENIFKKIIDREKLGMTEINSKVAIPHPIERIKNTNYIGVCISKKGVKWNKYNVNLIFFMFLETVNQENEYIYKIINNIINDEEVLNKIIKMSSNYTSFINNIKKVYFMGV